MNPTRNKGLTKNDSLQKSEMGNESVIFSD
jgi:hypothetical protein